MRETRGCMTHVIVSGLEGGDRNDLPPSLLRPGVMVADDTRHSVNSRKADRMTGLAFNSVADNRRLLERHVQTSKICLLLLLNLLKSTTDLLQICVYDRVECRSRLVLI